MNAGLARLTALQRAARRRALAAEMLRATPPGMAIVFATLRWSGPAMATGIALALMAGLLWRLLHVARRIDLRWATRRLDALEPALEDSTALLVQGGELNPLERLQSARVAARLATGTMPDVRPAWPAGSIAAASLAAVAIAALGLAWHGPTTGDGPARGPAAPGSPQAGTETGITARALEVMPPAYTGLAMRREDRLDTSAPAGSRLAWRLRFEPQPEAAYLATHDGRRIPLRREDADWLAEHVLEASLLYRVIVAGAPPVDPRLHRLDAVTDQPPRVAVLEPEQNVVFAEPGQREWTVIFEALDDYGLGASQLLLTLAQGSGELVDFTQVRRDVEGEGDVLQRRYVSVLDLEALGIGPGDDLVVQLEVVDNKAPGPQASRSASVVLRWPPPAMGNVEGFDGLMQRTLPAYFRSQRQIIIDTEQLLADAPSLPKAEFVARANAIGVDQQALRLRYGQFMGEEAESGELGAEHDEHDHPATPPPATRQGPAPNPLFADEAVHPDRHDDDGADTEHDHQADHGAVGEADGPAEGFGKAGDELALYGHVHDIPEAATLLDPETREVLRGALRAMWDAEGYLRVGEPASALPHEHRALALIKEVQRADRIYLARVGLELPPIEESRRLTGKIDDVTDRRDPLAPAADAAGPLPALWRALGDRAVNTEAHALFDAATRWILANPVSVEDPLGLITAIDTLQRDPACDACRVRLRSALWQALPVPAAGVLRRSQVDAAGARYFEALATGADP
ncbi:MAG: hypothetical protein ACNA8G_02340 [Gammaproteobacteria bacterium]